MYVDIAGSTQMSHDLSSLDLALIIQIFSQEVILAIEKFGGYVLKFVGDAVIGLFASDYDKKKSNKEFVRLCKLYSEYNMYCDQSYI